MPSCTFGPTRLSGRSFSAALVFGALCLARPASADVEEWAGGYIPEPSERRADLAVGLHLGGAMGSVVGYPNEVDKIDVPKYERSVRAGPGAAGSLWVGATLRDFFTFGLGVQWAELRRGGMDAMLGSAGLHLESFPLFYQGGALRDLGVTVDIGLGMGTVDRGGEIEADGGALSHLSVGVIYEALELGGGVNLGPFASYARDGSLTMTGDVFSLGLRTSFYSGPR